MKYDLFVLHAREDGSFAKAVAKSLQTYNISVFYQVVLSGKDTLRNAIDKGFEVSLFGIIVVSKNLFAIATSAEDLEYLNSCATLSDQILHIIWLHTSHVQVSKWSPALAECIAIQSPPETVDSIARKFQMKLAGTQRLQENTLCGQHPQIQYIPPIIPKFGKQTGNGYHLKNIESSLKQTNSEDFDNNIKDTGPDIEKYDSGEEIEPQNAESESSYQNIEEKPIGRCFSFEMRQQISKRLDVYLKGLSNWRNLAKEFKIKDETLKVLLSSGAPTMNLLDMLALRSVTLGEFNAACRSIDRNDVPEFIDKCIS